ncbi:MAG: ribosomal protein S18-alanine N-acetyltransferase [Candidatus Promineifilaceae bacterium]
MKPNNQTDAGFQFRPMTADDLDAVLAIETAVYHSPFSKSGYLKELQNDVATYQVLVGGNSAEIVGYVGHWLVLDECSISMVAVHPNWQGRGLGRRLMVKALTDSASVGATFATLEVRDGNLPAIHLYESLGFEIVGRRKRYYKKTGDDALLMTLAELSV